LVRMVHTFSLAGCEEKHRTDGCVHVDGDAGVSVETTVREEAVPVCEDG